MVVKSTKGNQHTVNSLVSQFQREMELDNVTKFSLYTYVIQLKFKNFVVGISPSDDTVFSKADDEEEVEFLFNNISHRITDKEATIENFAIIKYYLESLFLIISERGKLEFTYRQDYLTRSSELSRRLDVSRATVMRMVNNGMEIVEGVGYSCYPKHNAIYWKNGVWASRIQSLRQQFKLRNQTKEDLVEEIEKEIEQFRNRYKGDFEEVFAEVLSGDKDKYDLEEPEDFEDWRDLLKDLKELKDNGK